MRDFSRNAARYFAAAAATLFLISCGGSSDETPAPPPFGKTTYVVGASLSDNGNACNLSASNCPPSPPYAPGVYSNGTLWVTRVAAAYGASVTPSRLGGNDFAYAGARTGAVPGVTTAQGVPNMVQQVDSMLTRNGFLVIPQNLVVVDASAFGNNINDALTLAGANPANAQTIVTNAITAGVTDIVGIVNRLYAAGARNILLVTVPDIGKTPLLQGSGSPTAIATATTMSAQYNGALAQQMNNLRAVSPGLVISTLDLFALLTQVQANPGAYGFANATMACFVPPGGATPASLCSPDPAIQNTYLFWDPFHPTAGTGALMASTALTAIGVH
ncbi:MAG TPA: SGNH/GDSL hydrolase family protein [Burkholderiaceae bacterium]|nr:SGNH/GDSL hydrolase family protein [Burkholderiaceae bacterium]